MEYTFVFADGKGRETVFFTRYGGIVVEYANRAGVRNEQLKEVFSHPEYAIEAFGHIDVSSVPAEGIRELATISRKMKELLETGQDDLDLFPKGIPLAIRDLGELSSICDRVVAMRE